MGAEILGVPERAATPDLLVDWLEFAAFFAESGRVSATQLVEQMDLDTEGEDPEFADADVFRESHFSSISAEIRRRAKGLGESYPFRLSTDGCSFEFVVNAAYKEAQSTYLFTLILSHAPTSDILLTEAVPGEEEMRDAREVFQVCATIAAAGHTGGPAFSIGWPRRNKKALLVALRAAWVHCGDGEIVDELSPSIPPSVKDDGIDVLAFRRERDGGLTQGFLFGQVASGHDWKSKSAVQAADRFLKEWFRRQPAARPQPVTFIPFVLSADREKVRRNWLEHEYIISRTRLAARVQEGLELARNSELIVERVDDLPCVIAWVCRHRRSVLEALP